jgi:hypothetical protein
LPSVGRFSIAAVSALLLAGCSADLSDFSTSSVASYQPASLFSPNGYSVSTNADGSFHVSASGSPATPAVRLEKIALARAAEYGEEQHAKTFRATPAQTSFKCGRTKISSKEGPVTVKPLDYRIVAIDVTYGDDTQGPAGRSTRETAEALKAELRSETVPPEAQMVAAQEVAERCGR